MVPTELNITLEQALQINPDLRRDYENNEVTKRIDDLARRLEACLVRFDPCRRCGNRRTAQYRAGPVAL